MPENEHYGEDDRNGIMDFMCVEYNLIEDEYQAKFVKSQRKVIFLVQNA